MLEYSQLKKMYSNREEKFQCAQGASQRICLLDIAGASLHQTRPQCIESEEEISSKLNSWTRLMSQSGQLTSATDKTTEEKISSLKVQSSSGKKEQSNFLWNKISFPPRDFDKFEINIKLSDDKYCDQ